MSSNPWRTCRLASGPRSDGSVTVQLSRGDQFDLDQSLLSGAGISGLDSDTRLQVKLKMTDRGTQVVSRVRLAKSRPAAVRQPGQYQAQDQNAETPCTILVIGRTGVGKSSIINAIFGRKVAEVGDFEPTTSAIEEYVGTILGSQVKVLDTPGFCDASFDHSNDRRYLTLIRSEVGHLDLMLFVTRLDDSRVEATELHTIKLITEEFGQAIWERGVVALTRADAYPKVEDFKYRMEGRSNVLKHHLQSLVGSQADTIPFVPVSAQSDRAPDGRRWLTRLWMTMLDRLSDEGLPSFLLATLGRVELETPDESLRGPSNSTGGASTTAKVSRVDRERPDKPRSRTSTSSRPTQSGRIATPRLADGSAQGRRIADSPGASKTTHQVTSRKPAQSANQGSASPPHSAEPQSRHGSTPGLPAGPLTRSLVSPGPQSIGVRVATTDTLDVSPTLPAAVRRTEEYVDGIRVKRNEFQVVQVKGTGNIVASGDDMTIVQQIVENRAPDIIGMVKGAAVWVAKKVRKFFAP